MYFYYCIIIIYTLSIMVTTNNKGNTMTKLTDKQFKQLQKKLFEYVDGMNTDQLRYDLKRYMLEDYLTQPIWKLVSDKLIEFDLMEEEKEVA